MVLEVIYVVRHGVSCSNFSLSMNSEEKVFDYSMRRTLSDKIHNGAHNQPYLDTWATGKTTMAARTIPRNEFSPFIYLLA